MIKKSQHGGVMTPLWIITSFVTLTEVTAGYAVQWTTNGTQTVLICFVCLFPVLIAAAFFFVLWHKPYVLYPPTDFGKSQNVEDYVRAMKGITNQPEHVQPISPIQTAEKSSASISPNQLSISELQPLQTSLPTEAEQKTPADLRIEMIGLFYEGKCEDGEKRYLELIRSENDSGKRMEHEMLLAYLRYTHASDSRGLKDLERFSKIPELSSECHLFMYFAYDYYKDYTKAAFECELSIETSPLDSKVRKIALLADCKLKNGQAMQAIEILESALAIYKTPDDAARLYASLAEVYNSIPDLEMRALALEKAIENRPNDAELRFNAGWSYSECGFHHLSVFHYKSLTDIDRRYSMAYNNLAVGYKHFDLPINSVNNYEKSIQLNNTLAAANLGYVYLDAGLVSSAKTTLNDANRQNDVHPNIGSALAATAQREEEEAKKIKSILNHAQQEQRFFKGFSEAYFTRQTSTLTLQGQWMFENQIEFSLEVKDKTISAEWLERERKSTLIGNLRNLGAKITLKESNIKTDDAFFSLLTLGDSELSGYVYLSSSGYQLNFMIKKDSEFTFKQAFRVS